MRRLAAAFRPMMEAWLNRLLLLVGDLPRLALILGLFFLFTLIEKRFPARRGPTTRGRLRNLGFAAIYVAGGGACMALLLPLADTYLGSRPAPQVLNPTADTVILAVTYLFVTDFFYYWYHRAQHRWWFLWQVHELHHSDAELNATSSFRTYWLEQPIQWALTGIPVALLVGHHHTALWASSFVGTSWLILTHANLPLRLGNLTAILCGPQLHRIHHSALSQHADKNFAQFFPLYDVLFGTYQPPAPDEFPATGTPGLASDAPIKRVLALPFLRWTASAD